MKAIKKEVVWVGMTKDEATMLKADLLQKEGYSTWEEMYISEGYRIKGSTGRAWDLLLKALIEAKNE